MQVLAPNLSPRQATISKELGGKFGSLPVKTGWVLDRDPEFLRLQCMFRVLLSVKDHQSSEPTSYLDFIEDFDTEGILKTADLRDLSEQDDYEDDFADECDDNENENEDEDEDETEGNPETTAVEPKEWSNLSPSLRKKLRKAKANLKNHPEGTMLITYNISFEPVYEGKEVPPPEISDESEELFHEVQKTPKTALPKILAHLERFPDHPVLLNYLTCAYKILADHKAYEATVHRNHEKNPHYLFARMEYGFLCLDQSDFEGFEKEFPKFDLKLLYPDRTVFHVTEVSNFWIMLFQYYLRKMDFELARIYFRMLKKLVPHHPFLETAKQQLQLGKAFSKSNIMKALNTIKGWFDKEKPTNP